MLNRWNFLKTGFYEGINNGSKGMLHKGVSALVTQTIARRRRPRGIHPKRTDRELPTQKLPEYLEADEVGAIIGAADAFAAAMERDEERQARAS